MEKTLATRYAEAVDQIDAFRQTIAAANQRITELQALADSVPALNAKIAELETQAAADKKASDAAIAEGIGPLVALADVRCHTVTAVLALLSAKGDRAVRA